MPKSPPLHQVMEQSIQALNIATLATPETIVWAKLRGYPWWPGRVKNFEKVPKELALIAKSQYKPGTVVAVYFFGSHDFSLVPVESLRPFEENWDLFSCRSTGVRFKEALKEARTPDRYLTSEMAALNSNQQEQSKLILTSDESGTLHSEDQTRSLTFKVVKRKRGRPPKSRNVQRLQTTSSKTILRTSKRPEHLDSQGMATRDHILYCRVKLQKILLRKQLKHQEIPIAEKVLDVLLTDNLSLETIKNTRIGKILRIATVRSEFKDGGTYSSTGEKILSLLSLWKSVLNAYIAETGIL